MQIDVTLHEDGSEPIAGIAATLGLSYGREAVAQQKAPALRDRICLFTDHLDDAGYTL